MTLLLEPLRRALRAFLRNLRPLSATALLGLAALAGCGPGTGGTGTGPINGAYSFATIAGTAGATVPADDVSLKLEEQRVTLVAGCLSFVYTGAWGVDAQGLLVLDGTVTATAAGPAGAMPAQGQVPFAARLRLQFSEPTPASAQVTVTLADTAGRVLLGPVVVPRGEAAVSLPACTTALP